MYNAVVQCCSMSNTRKRTRKKSNVFALRLKPVTREVLTDLAVAEKRTLSNYVRCILEEHAEKSAA